MADFLTLTLIGLFILISIFIGWLSSKKETTEGFLTADRKLGLFQSVMTISGSFIGAMTLLVYTAFVFIYGISAIWIFIGFIIGFILFTIFAVHLYEFSKDKKFYTIADYFKFRFGKKIALLVISVIFIWYFGTLSAQFIGGGKVLNEITGFGYITSTIIMCAVILIYLLLGGFKSVIKTDIFQFIVLGIIIFALGLTIRTGLQVPASHFNPFNAGIVNIVAFLLLGILSPFAAQEYWQRVFAMKNKKVVKYSFIISGIIVLLISLVLTYIGLVAKTFFSNIDADIAVLYSFTRLVPPIMIGLVAVAFFAAILSTADTVLFVLSVNFTNDFLGMKNNDPRGKIKYTRISILVIGLLSLALALIYPNIVDITIIFKAIGIVIAPIVIIAWLTKGNRAAIISTILATTIGIIVLSAMGYVRPELIFVGAIGGFIVYGITLLVSKIFSK